MQIIFDWNTFVFILETFVFLENMFRWDDFCVEFVCAVVSRPVKVAHFGVNQTSFSVCKCLSQLPSDLIMLLASMSLFVLYLVLIVWCQLCCERFLSEHGCWALCICSVCGVATVFSAHARTWLEHTMKSKTQATRTSCGREWHRVRESSGEEKFTSFCWQFFFFSTGI